MVAAELLRRDRLEALGERGDLRVGEAIICLPHVEQGGVRLGRPHRERIVRQDPVATPVTALDSGDYYVEGRQRTLELDPRLPTTTRRV